MLTSRLVISTVACILILGMVELKLEDLEIKPVEIGKYFVYVIIIGHGPPKKDVKDPESGCKDFKIQNLKFQ